MQGYHRIHAYSEPDESILRTISKMDNQLIERYRATFRERNKVIKSLKTEKSAEQYLENWKTYYNFVRPNQAFN